MTDKSLCVLTCVVQLAWRPLTRCTQTCAGTEGLLCMAYISFYFLLYHTFSQYSIFFSFYFMS